MSAEAGGHRVSWTQARQLAFAATRALPPTTVSLSAAVARTLAEPVIALCDVPHYASSAMDGWAVRGSGPWVLAGGSSASAGAADSVAAAAAAAGANADTESDADATADADSDAAPTSSEARAIVTGGLIPEGFDAVLRSEAGDVDSDARAGGDQILRSTVTPWPGQHIRPQGEEFRRGDVAIEAGVRLNPAHIAVAAACGVDALVVRARGRVSLVLTGDEVVTHGIPAPGTVRDSFGPQLPAFVGMLGAEVVRQERVGDDHDALVRALSADASAHDVIITTGGTGSSSADHLRRALAELGARILVDGVAMRPGGPSLLARFADGRLLIGLPGNPLAAIMGLLTLAAPLLGALAGAGPPEPSRIRLAQAVPAGRGETRLIPFRLVDGLARPSAFTGSAMLRGLADASGVLICANSDADAGDELQFLTLPWA
ncbi:molybdopterin molybdotransferase MoeA [Agreia sp.]|uniref:molybdopterin molybdotransferase MoeA n=1 Tax=Agreia sp. TaxID=1872416 RepID=UPI0035BBFEDC